VNFSGAPTTALPGRTIASYFWTFGDGASGSGVSTSHRYGSPGAFAVTLLVTDSAGKTNTVQKTVTVE
jgi:PKD repeat protein